MALAAVVYLRHARMSGLSVLRAGGVEVEVAGRLVEVEGLERISRYRGWMKLRWATVSSSGARVTSWRRCTSVAMLRYVSPNSISATRISGGRTSTAGLDVGDDPVGPSVVDGP